MLHTLFNGPLKGNLSCVQYQQSERNISINTLKGHHFLMTFSKLKHHVLNQVAKLINGVTIVLQTAHRLLGLVLSEDC